MSPTTSVKALLADTQAAPLPSPSSSIPEASTLAFDQQQAALRRRKTAGSTLKDGEDQVNAADRETGQSGKDDSKTPSPGALVDSKAKSGSSSHTEGARPTFQQTLQDLRQFLLHFLRILPCKGFQSYLKKIIGPIVRLFVRGVATILHRGQYGLASNVAFDIHLLIWKVSLGSISSAMQSRIDRPFSSNSGSSTSSSEKYVPEVHTRSLEMALYYL